MKKYLQFFLLLGFLFTCILAELQAQTTITIGSGTATQRQPLGVYFGYERSAAIYTNTEIGVTGEIQKVAWQINTAHTAAIPLKIYLQETTASTLTASTWASLTTSATLVYDATVNLTTGWYELTLSNPFIYSGSDNLLVLVETNFGGTGSGTSTSTAITYSAATNQHQTWATDNTAPTTTGSLSSNRPNLQLTIQTGPPPTCPKPSLLTVANITANDVDLGWTANGTETTWNIEYGPSGFTLGTGTSITVNSNPYSLAGLSASTNYAFYVQADCGGGDVSTWAGPKTFATSCGTTNIPYTQNFESVVVPTIPDCHTIEKIGSGNNWVTASNPGSGFTTKVLKYGYNSSNAANAWFYTPGINLTGGVSYQLDFEYGNNSTTYVEKLKVLYGTSPANASMLNSIVDFPNINQNAKQTASINFTPASDGVYYLGFNVYSASNQYNLYVDNITLDLSPTCPKPSALAVSNITANDANLSWTNGNTETAWNVEYGPIGFTQGTGTLVPAASNPFTLTGLSESTDYSFYVQADCGGGDVSLWVGPISFSTPQTPATLPYIVDFETPPSDWDFVNGTEPNKWEYGIATAHNGTQSLYVSNDGGITNAYTIGTASRVHIYRDISFPAGTQFNLSFWWKGIGEPAAADDFLRIFLVDPSTKPVAGTLPTVGQIGITYYNQAAWKQENIIIDATAANQIKRIIFTWKNDGSVGTQPPIAIDDIEITVVTCVAPSALASANITQSTADLSWTAGGSETAWNVEYGPAGFTQGTGTIVAANSNPFTLTGLSPSSSYAYYVQADCGGGDVSIWTGPQTFTTACGVSSLNFIQGFNATSIPNCWTQQFITGTSAVQYVSTSADPTTNPQEGTHFAKWNSYSITSGNETRLASPPISTIGVPNIDVTFYWYNENNTSYNTGNYLLEGVQVQYSLDGTTWTDAGSFIPRHDASLASGTGQWKLKTITLPAVAGDTTVYVGFKFHSSYGDNCSLDNVVILPSPTCIAPSNLTVANITENSASLGWTTYGTETTWNVEYGPAGFTQGTGTILPANSNPFSLTGLTESTNYTFYVQADCGGGDVSAWAGPIPFTTACIGLTSFNENFDAVATPNLPNCWFKSTPAAYAFATVESYATGPNSTPNCIRMYNSGASASDHVLLISPYLTNLSSGTNQLRFYAKGNSSITSVIVGTIANPTDANTFTPFQTITGLSTSNYTECTVNFASYSGTDDYIAIKHPANATYLYLYVDDLNWELLPTCPKPSNLAVTNITNNSAELSWTNGNTETAWNVEYGPIGFVQGTGTIVPASSNPFILTGLSESTDYSFYIQADCGSSDVSLWVGPVNFSTPQTPATLPYIVDFETPPSDWDIVNGTQVNKWEHGTATAHNGTQSLYISNDVGVANAYTTSTSAVVHAYRDISFPAGSEFNLSFWWKAQGESGYDFLKIYLIDPATKPVAGTQLSSGQIGTAYNLQSNWTSTSLTIDGASAANQIKRLVFSWRNDGSGGSQPPVAIDDIELSVLTCPAPATLTATNITETTAELGWTTNGTETAWNVEYGPAGFTQGTGTIVPATSNPFILTGLSESTDYSFYVQADCGASDVSLWVGPISFSTPQTPATLPYLVDFETPPSDWDIVNGTQVNKWEHGTATAHNGTQSLYISNDVGVANTYTTSTSSVVHAYRDISFPAGSEFNFSFWWKAQGESGYDFLKIYLIDPTTKPIAGTQLSSGQIGTAYNLQSNWTNASLTIDGAAASNQIKRLVFSWRNDGSGGSQPPIALDDISINILSCPAPTSLTASNATENSINLGWTNGATETAWNIEYGLAGFTQGSGTIINVTSNPYTLSGLSSSTNYAFYVQADCGSGDLSNWTGPFSFSTSCGISNIPYSQNFETAVVPAIPDCNTIENAGLGNNWVTANNPGYGFTSKTLKYNYNFDEDANAWFYTPGLNLTGGVTYNLSFRYGNYDDPDYYESMKVAYGDAANSAAMINTIIDYPTIDQGIAQNASIDFTPTTSGVYYIGFNAYSIANQYYLYVDDILIDYTNPPVTHAVNFSVVNPTGGSIGATVNSVAIINGANVVDGQNVDFTASPNSGYRVKEWKVNGSIIAGNTTNNYTLANLTSDANVTVEFELIPALTHLVNFSIIGANGSLAATVNSVAITSGANVNNGSNVAFTATPNSGFRVKEWKLNSVVITANTSNNYTLSNLSANANVTVEFEAIPPTYVVNFNIIGANGTLTAAVDGNSITSGANVEAGKTVNFVATPNATYRIKEWKQDGNIIAGNTTPNFSIANLSATTTVSVEFELIPSTNYQVNFAVIGANGTLQANVGGTPITSGALVPEGSNVVFVAVPNSGYGVKEWQLNSNVIASNTTTNYTLLNLSAASNVTVEFKLLATGNSILTFSFNEQIEPAVINNTDHTVKMTVAENTNLTSLIATFTISDAAIATVAGINQVSGVTANDFSSNVTYKITAENGIAQDWIVSTILGIDEFLASPIKIYPNPTKSILNIDLGDLSKVKIEVSSVIGKDITSVENAKGIVNIDLSKCTKGIYLVKIQYNDKIVIRKIQLID